MEFSYKTKGVCARSILIDVEDDTVKGVRFEGGCSGNTQGGETTGGTGSEGSGETGSEGSGGNTSQGGGTGDGTGSNGDNEHITL